MSLKIKVPKSASKNIPLLEAGTYVGRCFKMIHQGTNDEVILGKTKTLNKVRLYWELPDEMMVFDEEKGEQPRVISKEFTLSLHEKSNLRKTLESWRGKTFTAKELDDFDLTKLMGAACMITVIHKATKDGKEYVQISSITKLMKNMKCPKQVNETFVFGFDPFEPEKFDQLPDFIKEKVQTSVEYREIVGGEKPVEIEETHEVEAIDEADDLPF